MRTPLSNLPPGDRFFLAAGVVGVTALALWVVRSSSPWPLPDAADGPRTIELVEAGPSAPAAVESHARSSAASDLARPSNPRWIVPVRGVDPADLRDTFDDPRGGDRVHAAVDIHAPAGTEVLAATDGEILRLFESEFGGTTLYQLAADRRTVLYYAHLQGYAAGVASGMQVETGTVLGYVGDTGNAVPGDYHLHFAVWTVDDRTDFWTGDPVDPLPFLRR